MEWILYFTLYVCIGILVGIWVGPNVGDYQMVIGSVFMWPVVVVICSTITICKFIRIMKNEFRKGDKK